MLRSNVLMSGAHRARVPALLCAIGLAATTAACAKADSTTSPSGPAVLELSVSPKAIAPGGTSCAAPFNRTYGPFGWTLRETGGRPVTMTSFTWVVKDVSGADISTEETVQSLGSWFVGASVSSLTIPADASFTSRLVVDCERPTFPGGTLVFTATGTDDNGTRVSASTTLTLLP